ncbi:hemopexin repeat-containing protein [Streptomyces deserti]
MFKGDSYLSYFEKPGGKDTYEPWLRTVQHWPGWPASAASGVNAALQGTGPYEGKAYFFFGSKYLRYDLANHRVDVPHGKIADWPGVISPFTEGIDAAIHGIGEDYGVCWLFRGGQYIRYNMNTSQAEGGPQSITGNWNDWPSEFADGVDLAFYGTGSESRKIYFFRGDQYIRFDLQGNRVDKGPSPIVERWPVMSRFMQRPQLFLVEEYKLHTFLGKVGAGELIAGAGQSTGGRTKTTFYIVTKTNETIEQKISSNILESSSTQAVKEFSDALRSDESQSGSEEQYAYSMDASFRGRAKVTVGGGKADADLNVRGSSQDVRSSFASAVGTQLQRHASDTKETHRQRVSVQSAEYKLDMSKETGYVIQVDNSDGTVPLNYQAQQLTQEYIVVLSLSDASLAFLNGDDRQERRTPLRGAGELLEACLLEPTARDRVEASIVDALQHIIDVNGETRSLEQTTSSLTTTCSTKSGTLEVPGIALKVDTVVVSTPNTILTQLK